MHQVKQRLIELAVIGKHRALNEEEAREWEEARQAIINHLWKIVSCQNFMYMANQIGDKEWYAELNLLHKILVVEG